MFFLDFVINGPDEKFRLSKKRREMPKICSSQLCELLHYYFFFFLLLYSIFIIYIFSLVRGRSDITLEVEWPEGFTPPPDDVVRAALMSDGEEDGSVSDTDSE